MTLIHGGFLPHSRLPRTPDSSATAAMTLINLLKNEQFYLLNS